MGYHGPDDIGRPYRGDPPPPPPPKGPEGRTECGLCKRVMPSSEYPDHYKKHKLLKTLFPNPTQEDESYDEDAHEAGCLFYILFITLLLGLGVYGLWNAIKGNF
jgi:hypothetical protein